jgi:hypothetical protein
MSKRLQVLMSDSEYDRLRTAAERERVSVGEWVRRVVRRSAEETDVRPTDAKLAAIRRALDGEFPIADIDQMNREIMEGRTAGLP